MKSNFKSTFKYLCQGCSECKKYNCTPVSSVKNVSFIYCKKNKELIESNEWIYSSVRYDGYKICLRGTRSVISGFLAKPPFKRCVQLVDGFDFSYSNLLAVNKYRLNSRELKALGLYKKRMGSREYNIFERCRVGWFDGMDVENKELLRRKLGL